jgi:hypothetical protein
MNKLYEQEHDMTKKMLDTMRNGSPEKPVLVEEHDITKKMLNTMRNGVKLITESEEVSGGMESSTNGVTNVDQEPSEAEDLSPDEMKNIEKAFMDSVSPKVQFNGFKIYRKEQNAVFSGVFQDLGGLEWVMSLKDSDGLNITVQSLKIDDNTITTMNKLYGFYKNWSKEWSVKLHTEYRYKE